MRYAILTLIALALLVGGCHSAKQAKGQKWTESELMMLQGKTRDEVKEVLGKPDGFYTRSQEGRWHYSNILLDQEGAGSPKKVWVVIYFSQAGDQRATIVEIHDHKDD